MGAGISASLGAFSSLIAGLQPGEMLGGESSRRGGGGWPGSRLGSPSSPPDQLQFSAVARGDGEEQLMESFP